MDQVIWHEGMLVTPQHLQASAAFDQQQLSQRFRALGYPNSGIFGLRWDTTQLEHHMLALPEAELIFPSGLFVSWSDRRNIPPPSINLSQHKKALPSRLSLFLAISHLTESGPNVIDLAHGTLLSPMSESQARFRAVACHIGDWTQSSNSEHTVLCAQPRVRLVVGDELDERAESIQVGIVEYTSHGTWELDTRFVPNCLRLTAASDLSRRLAAICQRMQKMLKTLQQESHPHANASLKASILAALPLIADAAYDPQITPRRAYDLLRQASGLCACLVDTKVAACLGTTHFDASDLEATFSPLLLLLTDTLRAHRAPSRHRVALVGPPSGPLSASLSGIEQPEACRWFLAISQVDEKFKEEASRWLRLCKLAAASWLDRHVQSALPAIGLQPIQGPLAQLGETADSLFFPGRSRSPELACRAQRACVWPRAPELSFPPASCRSRPRGCCGVAMSDTAALMELWNRDISAQREITHDPSSTEAYGRVRDRIAALEQPDLKPVAWDRVLNDIVTLWQQGFLDLRLLSYAVWAVAQIESPHMLGPIMMAAARVLSAPAQTLSPHVSRTRARAGAAAWLRQKFDTWAHSSAFEAWDRVACEAALEGLIALQKAWQSHLMGTSLSFVRLQTALEKTLKTQAAKLPAPEAPAAVDDHPAAAVRPPPDRNEPSSASIDLWQYSQAWVTDAESHLTHRPDDARAWWLLCCGMWLGLERAPEQHEGTTRVSPWHMPADIARLDRTLPSTLNLYRRHWLQARLDLQLAKHIADSLQARPAGQAAARAIAAQARGLVARIPELLHLKAADQTPLCPPSIREWLHLHAPLVPLHQTTQPSSSQLPARPKRSPPRRSHSSAQRRFCRQLDRLTSVGPGIPPEFIFARLLPLWQQVRRHHLTTWQPKLVIALLKVALGAHDALGNRSVGLPRAHSLSSPDRLLSLLARLDGRQGLSFYQRQHGREVLL